MAALYGCIIIYFALTVVVDISFPQLFKTIINAVINNSLICIFLEAQLLGYRKYIFKIGNICRNDLQKAE